MAFAAAFAAAVLLLLLLVHRICIRHCIALQLPSLLGPLFALSPDDPVQ
jgi:hypothetical protein